MGDGGGQSGHMWLSSRRQPISDHVPGAAEVRPRRRLRRDDCCVPEVRARLFVACVRRVWHRRHRCLHGLYEAQQSCGEGTFAPHWRTPLRPHRHPSTCVRGGLRPHLMDFGRRYAPHAARGRRARDTHTRIRTHALTQSGRAFDTGHKGLMPGVRGVINNYPSDRRARDRTIY